ncbi:hypothetical protein JCM8097_005675 [Rhodosporidiobolus ruineniae]
MLPSNTSLREEAARAERLFLDAVESGSTEGVEQRLSSFFHYAAGALHRADPSTLATLARVASCINIVSTNLHRFDAHSHCIQQESRVQARSYLSTTPSAFTSPTTSPATTAQADLPTLDDSSLCDPYRDWYLSHFTNPYPTASDKDHLLRLVPSHDKKKLDTWFTNNRRRSGWQALRRAFTDGTAEDFQRLLDAVDRNDEGVSGQAREKVRAVRRFFEDGSRDKVSDEIQQIVEAAHGGARSTSTATASRTRSEGRVEARASRGVGASSSSLSSPSSDFAPPLPRTSPYARPTPLTPPRRTARVASVDFSSAGPRYPSSSTFSSPTSSLRSASGSSASSLDSLVSYASFEGVEPLPLPPASSAAVPSSPPASSSLLSFAGSSSSSSRPPTYSHSLRTSSTSTRRAALPAQPMHPPNPYFCTLDELPTASSALAFAGMLGGRLATTPEGDLLVE